uniref:Putative secreted protein n=1 Tax=Ixodes ricinus TaxID=34613 RepID=A0A6B0UV18_IXORI
MSPFWCLSLAVRITSGGTLGSFGGSGRPPVAQSEPFLPELSHGALGLWRPGLDPLLLDELATPFSWGPAPFLRPSRDSPSSSWLFLLGGSSPGGSSTPWWPDSPLAPWKPAVACRYAVRLDSSLSAVSDANLAGSERGKASPTDE